MLVRSTFTKQCGSPDPGIFRDTRPHEPMRRRLMERKTRLQFYGASISMSNVWKHFLRMVSKKRTLKWLPMLWEVLVRYIPSTILHHAFETVAGCSTLQFLVKELDIASLPRGPTIQATYLVLQCCKIFHNYYTVAKMSQNRFWSPPHLCSLLDNHL